MSDPGVTDPGVIPEMPTEEVIRPTGPFYGPIVAGAGESSRFPRLTHRQWENTVRDLLGLEEPLGLSSAFIAEPLRSTFNNDGSALEVGPDVRLDYQSAAESVASLIADDPVLTGRFLEGGAEDARRFIENFGLHAYRRPLTEAEITRYLAFFAEGETLVASGDAFRDGVLLLTSFMLQSPHFLYRAELSATPNAEGKVALSGHEVASRLSYGLINSMPDEALLAAAESGGLATHEQVKAEAQRLLNSPPARETVADFHDQLIKMDEYLTVSRNNHDLFGEGVGADLLEEGIRFVENVVFEEETGLGDLLTASYTFGNDRIRELYGLEPTGSDEWSRIELDPAERAGLLTQIGFLAANGEGDTPNTIIRGVHIARKVLCVELPEPPDDVPPLPEIPQGSTNRNRVEVATGEATCAGCHAALINPVGFAFEAYDGYGAYRTEDNGEPVDASATYTLDGAPVSYDGAVEFMNALAGSTQAHECYSQRWAEYLYGRELNPGEVSDLNVIAQGGALSKTESTVKNLILNLVATDAFTTRRP